MIRVFFRTHVASDCEPKDACKESRDTKCYLSYFHPISHVVRRMRNRAKGILALVTHVTSDTTAMFPQSYSVLYAIVFWKIVSSPLELESVTSRVLLYNKQSGSLQRNPRTSQGLTTIIVPHYMTNLFQRSV